MTTPAFEKWEGLGNDFILVRRQELTIEAARRLAPTWCDRRFGIGADGILLVSDDPASMVVINADGSRPEMCGNGIRCVAGYFASATKSPPPHIMSDAGPRAIRTFKINGDTADISVDMGIPSVDPDGAGVTSVEPHPDGQPITLHADPIKRDGYVVSVGNPHWIFLADEPRDVSEFGPKLERDHRFEHRTNVEWVSLVGDNHFRVDVWERGAGQTLACGTGATAVAFLLQKLGRTEAGKPVRITLPGGDLSITVEKDGQCWMRGPAHRVFSGTVAPRLLE